MTAEERREYYSKETVRPTPLPWQKPIDSFNCRHCGKLVGIFDRFDKRQYYCSRQCEKNYWRRQSLKKNNDGKRERRDLE